MSGFRNVKFEYPNPKRDLCKAMHMTLTDDKSSLYNQSEKSSHNDTRKYMAFTSMVKSESLEDKEKSNASQERSKDDLNIYKAFDELF